LQENNIEHPLKDIMLSVDLAILGQADEVYKGYAAAVRAEYQHISEAVYRASRKLVLSHFLSKAKSDELFNDRYFSELYSQQSILNIEWELTNLDGTYLA
jgi:pantetheine-phosphate adenylyltransferase